MILAILFFVKLATAYMDYRQHGQFEFTAPAILFGCLVFSSVSYTPLAVYKRQDLSRFCGAEELF